MENGVSALLGKIYGTPLSDTDTAAIHAALEDGADPVIAAQISALLQRFSVLVKVNNTVAQSLSLDHMLPRLMAVIAQVLHAERATLFLHDD